MSDASSHSSLARRGTIAFAQAHPWLVLVILVLGFCMILLDSTVVQIAIPKIIVGLHTNLAEILWVINAYILVYAVFLIPAGRLGDMYGQRAMYAGGLALFTVASALCGFAHNATQLIMARVLQGFGGALLTPQTLAVLTTIFPPERRGAAFGVWGAAAGIAAIAGPTLGGLIVTTWGWPWVFFINLPIGVVALVATFLLVPDIRFGRQHGLDFMGLILTSVGLFLIVFGLIEGERFAWGPFWRGLTIPELMVLGVVALVAFGLWERTQTEPLLPLSLFRDRAFLMMNGVVAVMSFAMLGVTVVLPILLQSALRLTAFQAGLTVAPMSMALMIMAPWAGRLADGKAREYIPITGLLFFAACLALIVSTASPSASSVTFVGPMILGGLGIAFVMPPSTSIAMRSITPQMAGAASGVLNTTRQLGGVIGSAVVGALLQNRLAVSGSARAVSTAASLSPELRQRFVESFIAAMRPTLFVPIAVLVLTVVSCLVIIRAGRAEADAPERGALIPKLSKSES